MAISYWGLNDMKLRYLAASVFLGSIATAAAADILVVRATGPSARNFPAGKSIPDDARIALKANDTLVVLDARGTRTLRGPGTFTPGGPAQAGGRQSAIAAVARGGPARRARVGAVRGTGDKGVRPANLWQIDVAKSSNICVADPSTVSLWRGDATNPVTLTVTRASDGQSQQLSWQAGQATLPWPEELAISDGANYNLSWGAATPPTSLKFRTLPAKPGGLEEMASSLIQNGCEAQLDVLIETVKLPDDQAVPAG